MKDKPKKILIPFFMMLVFNLITNNVAIFWDYGVFAPHVGILFFAGLLFGPYGAIGAVAGNIIVDLTNGYLPHEILSSAIISFGVSYLAYKIWYSGFHRENKVTRPILDDSYHMMLFIADIIICGLVYSVGHGCLLQIFFDNAKDSFFMVNEYFMNFLNISFIFGIISIWLSKKTDIVQIPKKSKKTPNRKLYRILFCLLIISTLTLRIIHNTKMHNLITVGFIISTILLYAYLTKPFEHDVIPIRYTSITEKITTIFLLTTLFITVSGILISFFATDINIIINADLIGQYIPVMHLLVITDSIILLFFIPGFFIIRYVESRVIKPISSFSQIESFIHENQKIESKRLIDVYSDYINEDDEIGMLARSYTNLINHNNNYIENIHEIEGEKERIKAELDIATRIQASNLPTESIVTDEYQINGYSHPAKEVGGDFFDYYPLDDDNLAMVIGDASGKGVPAALLATITQVITKQLVKNEIDPSKVLYLLNNQLCENNPESMFITLWLGIYNRSTGKITFSNAGHNPPLIKENDGFRYLDIDTGIVLGILEDFDYVKEEIEFSTELVLYTDGITDANNSGNDMYGEERLLEFFNGFKQNDDPIKPLLKEISEFTKGNEQFDDMTLLYLKKK